MNRGIYSSASGLTAAEMQLEVISNNLANASTTGFKQDGITFGSAMNQALVSEGNSIGSISTGVGVAQSYTDFSPGAIQTTGNPLDFAIQSPNGAFAVQTPTGINYTRDGSFELNDQRQLVTKQGYQVLADDSKPITVAQGEIQVNEDGTISANGVTAGKLGVFDGQFQKIGGNLYSADATPTQIAPPIAARSIETSNVNPIQAMIQMITLNRHYELAQNSMQQHDTLTQRLISSLQG
jgi:flagellar basal-body rod protein FlgF